MENLSLLERVEKAKLEMDNQNFEKAFEIMQNAILLNPKDDSLYLNAGIILNHYLKKNNSYYYNKAIDLNPENAMAYYYRGLLENSFELFEIALEDFNTSIELDPEEYLFYMARSSTYLNLKDFENSILDCEKFVSSNPEIAYSRIAEIKLEQGLYKEAEINYLKALEYTEDGSDYIVNLANTYYQLQEYNKAIDLYQKIIKNNPFEIDAYWYKACCHKKLDEFSLAIEELNKVILYGISSYEYYLLRGECYYITEDFGKALSDFEKALELNPNNEDIVSNIVATKLKLQET